MTTLRTAVATDDESLVDLHLACWREAYAGLVPADLIESTFADRAAALTRRREQRAAGRALWVAESAGSLVGFASGGPARHEHAPAPVELYALYTRAAVWGTGVGHALCVAAIGEVAAYLWVLAGNARAIGFYERQGFALDGTEKDAPAGLDLRMVRLG